MAKTQGTVRYAELFPGVEMICRTDSRYMDSFVFAKPEASRAIVRLMNPEGLKAAREKEGGISLSDGEETVFVLPAPVLFDSAGNIGTAKVLIETIQENNQGSALERLRISYVLDPAFMEQAVYPVTLDPTIRTATEDSGIEDTYVRSGDPNGNNGKRLPCYFVGNLQSELYKLKLYRGELTGIYDLQAYYAVKQYQLNVGLKSDGRFRPNMREMLFEFSWDAMLSIAKRILKKYFLITVLIMLVFGCVEGKSEYFQGTGYELWKREMKKDGMADFDARLKETLRSCNAKIRPSLEHVTEEVIDSYTIDDLIRVEITYLYSDDIFSLVRLRYQPIDPMFKLASIEVIRHFDRYATKDSINEDNLLFIATDFLINGHYSLTNYQEAYDEINGIYYFQIEHFEQPFSLLPCLKDDSTKKRINEFTIENKVFCLTDNGVLDSITAQHTITVPSLALYDYVWADEIDISLDSLNIKSFSIRTCITPFLFVYDINVEKEYFEEEFSQFWDGNIQICDKEATHDISRPAWIDERYESFPQEVYIYFLRKDNETGKMKVYSIYEARIQEHELILCEAIK